MKVLLVDDHPVVRAGLRALLGGVEGIEVCGEAATGEEALHLAAALHPEVVLMDLQLGQGIDGVETTRLMAQIVPAPRVLVLTTYDSDADIVRAVAAGATGYLLKDTAPEELFRAIKEAAQGRTVLSSPVASRLARRTVTPEPSLSPREVELLHLLAEGLTNAQIGRKLHIGQATVKTHLVHIFAKLGVDSRTAAVTAAVARRLIRLPGQ